MGNHEVTVYPKSICSLLVSCHVQSYSCSFCLSERVSKFFQWNTDYSTKLIFTLHFKICKKKGSILRNKRPTWCHLLFHFTSYALNMFRTLIYPSSGACDYSVELTHWSYCSWFDVCWSFGVVGLEWYLCCRLIIRSLRLFCWITTLVVLFLVQIPLQPNHTKTPTHIEPRTIRPMW